MSMPSANALHSLDPSHFSVPLQPDQPLPSLTTARLRLVPFSEPYLTPRYVSWLNDPEVVRYSEQRHHVHTLESCRAYLNSFAGTPNYFWAILAVAAPAASDEEVFEPASLSAFTDCAGKRSELCHIGNITASVDVKNGVADIGILIGERSVWGRGFGSEAWDAVCRFLLCDRRLRKVTAGTLSINRAMLRIMQHAGMIEDGRRYRQVLIEGKEVDIVHAALFHDDDAEKSE